MFSRLREPFGKAGLIVAIVALVAALVGGAYAANSGKRDHKKSSAGLNGKQKKEVKTIAKGFQGTGPAGPQGPAGANGKDGANGSNGAPGEKGLPGTAGTGGTAGKNIVTGTELPGAHCAEGGFWGEVEGSSAKRYACNGEEGAGGAEGSPWTAGGTLPASTDPGCPEITTGVHGCSETGAWSMAGIGAEETQLGDLNLSSLSFAIPLEAPLSASNAFYVKKGQAGSEHATECPGTVAEPKAVPGDLCVYASFEEEVAAQFIEPTGTSGAVLFSLVTASSANAGGSWAVTAP